MQPCPKCGREEFKSNAGRAAHVRQCKAEVSQAARQPEPEPGPEHMDSEPLPEPKAKPALLANMRQQVRLGVGQRTLKMVAARCDICQAGRNVPPDWHLSCPHEKYVTVVAKPRTKTVYEDTPEGRKVVGTETFEDYEPVPNWVEVAVSPRINRGRGYHRGRYRGRILATDLRTELWPDGIAPVCQYRGCFAQHGGPSENPGQFKLKVYKSGVFCREEEARLVWFDQEGKTLEYQGNDVDSRSKRESMLAEAAI